MRLIDADALEREGWSLCRTFQKDKDTMVYEVKKLSDFLTIEPERKKGKWINVNDGKWNTIEVLKCSVCGEMDNRMNKTDNFCPNCGADMRGEENGKNE